MHRTGSTNRTGNRNGGKFHASRDRYQEVTDRIIAALEAGTPPWRRPWDPDKAGGPALPRNAVTGQRYRGINVLTLGLSALSFPGGDPRWATYKQAEERGWQVRKGERGTTAFFFKRIDVRDAAAAPDDDRTKHIPLLRAFALFHASQIEGIPVYVPPTIAEAPWREPQAADIIVANAGIAVHIGGDRAFYSPAADRIHMPPRHAFHSASGWNSTLLHEAGHGSGHRTRLNRDLSGGFWSESYAIEELKVEIAQATICAELGIAVSDDDFANNAAYVKSWLERLRSDRREIFRAAADAQRIADYLLAFHPAWAARNRREPGEGTDEQAATAHPVPDTGASVPEAA